MIKILFINIKCLFISANLSKSEVFQKPVSFLYRHCVLNEHKIKMRFFEL